MPHGKGEKRTCAKTQGHSSARGRSPGGGSAVGRRPLPPPASSGTQSRGGRWAEVAHAGPPTPLRDLPALGYVPSEVIYMVAAFLENAGALTPVRVQNRLFSPPRRSHGTSDRPAGHRAALRRAALPVSGSQAMFITCQPKPMTPREKNQRVGVCPLPIQQRRPCPQAFAPTRLRTPARVPPDDAVSGQNSDLV